MGMSVEPLHAHGMQGAIVRELDSELDGAAAHFAIFYVFAFAGGQVDARFEALTAIGALHGHELLELTAAARARATAGARFEHGLEPIELVDVTLIAAGDAFGERVER